jgi:hypothetical protein
MACLILVALLVSTGCASTSRTIEVAEESPSPWDDGITSGEDDEAEEVEDQVEVCVRKSTSIRVDYQPCDDKEKGYVWRFLPITGKIPAVGKKVGKGSDSTGSTYRAPAKGGKGRKIMISDDRDRIEICVREKTHVRVADTYCEDEESGYAWYYLLLSRQVPAVGKQAARGTYYMPVDSESRRARRAGGKGSKAAIEEEPAEEDPADEEDPVDTDDDSRTTTFNNNNSTGRCISCTRNFTRRGRR